MYKIALVQNQSEMSHYGYADARPLFTNTTYAGYEVILYTGQNIDILAKDISAKEIDALIIASHALNDKAINSALFKEEFKNALSKFLKMGFGCLILHQLRLGERARDVSKEEGQLLFLPDEYSNIVAMARPRTDSVIESATVGEITFSTTSMDHFLLNYPNELKSEEIQEKCVQEGGLHGLYWHYWENVDNSKWDVLVEDHFSNRNESRVLMVSAKESSGFRIVLSSLTLDWQHQNDVLENVIKYIVEGHQYMALLTTNHRPTIGLAYLMERLKSKRFSYKHYIIPQNIPSLIRAVKRGYHSIIVARRECFSILDKTSREEIDITVRDGSLKLLEVGEAEFTVYGRERDTQKLLHEIELKIQSELGNGFIDFSFWSTIESLQVLKRLSECNLPLNKKMLANVIELVNKHDMNGSYDEVFGASCALLWLRSTFLGPSDNQTKQTAEWIRNKIDQYEPREKALALLNMVQSGFSCSNGMLQDDENRLRYILNNLDYEKQSEINALMYLQVANAIKEKNAIKKLSQLLCNSNSQRNGIWVDVSTTATCIVALLEARAILIGDDDITDKIDNSLFTAVIAIQKARTRDSSTRVYLWDSKASTNLKCLEALLNFERTIELPVTEMIDSLETYAHSSIDLRTIDSSLKVLLETQMLLKKSNERNNNLMNIVIENRRNERLYRRSKKLIWAESVMLSVLWYIILLFISFFSLSNQIGIGEYLISQLPLHLTFLGVIAAVIFGILAIRQSRKEKNDDK